jgi:hypothetical protein
MRWLRWLVRSDEEKLRYGYGRAFCAGKVDGSACLGNAVSFVGSYRVPLCQACKLEYEAMQMKEGGLGIVKGEDN